MKVKVRDLLFDCFELNRNLEKMLTDLRPNSYN
ncbi:MAG: hypothetical protein ACI87N_000541 [Flavobacteriales bacterium]|jgi:hypothetical protein